MQHMQEELQMAEEDVITVEDDVIKDDDDALPDVEMSGNPVLPAEDQELIDRIQSRLDQEQDQESVQEPPLKRNRLPYDEALRSSPKKLPLDLTLKFQGQRR